jgi:hypothetical protein
VCASCGKPVTDAYLCTGCTRELANALVTTASIASDIDDAIARLLKRGTGGKSSQTEAPLPLDLGASDAADELHTVLTGWSGALLMTGEAWPYDTRSLAYWLLARLDRIRQNHQTPAIYPRFRTALHAAIRVIDRLPERVPAGHCAECGAQLLAELGADEVTCRCGVLTTALRATRRERAAAADILGTATEISGALEQLGIRVDAGTIRTWASRGRLAQRPGAVYAMSDVLALCAQRDSRR